jgi:predicted DNA-binding transcriptional regulator AlpA
MSAFSFENRALLSLEEACEQLGIAVKTARNLLSAGTFPIKTVRLGGRRMVVSADLARFIRSLTDDDTHENEAPARRGRGRPRKTAQAEGGV